LFHPKEMKSRLLVLRVGFLSTLWVIVALFVITFVSALIYREANERNFERLLRAHLFSLVGFVNIGENGQLQGIPELGDIRYNTPNSGWYWEVVPIKDNVAQNVGEPPLKSPSLGGADIASKPESTHGFDEQFIRSYQTQGVQGERILIVESDIVLENMVDLQNSHTARFRIMGNMAELEAQFDVFWATMRWYLIVFGLLTALINAAMIVLGLRPLARIRRSIAAIRTGEAVHVDENLPLEVQPLAREMNALIDNNRHIVERFRLQLGNLAHALKTPLAVIGNEAASLKGEQGKIIAEQTHAMRERIEHYLQRARIAAQRGSVVYRTDTCQVIERLVRVMTKLYPDHRITCYLPDEVIFFAGEAQDLEEMIGNLLENAGKWAKNRIHVTLKINEEDNKQQASLIIWIDDDGVGLDDKQMHQALQRGHRLDESVSGSGLGLSIVADMVRDYDGTFTLERSIWGGLSARLHLPRAMD